MTPEQRRYFEVARLHASSISEGFLPTLGVGFLSLMYEAIDQGSDTVLLVVEHEGQVVGFIAGAVGMGPVYKRMLKRFPRLFLALLPALFSPFKVKRILEVLLYSRRGAEKSLPKPELLSIAVHPAFRGSRVSESLYRALCAHFARHGVPQFKITVGSQLKPAHRFYSRMGAIPVANVAVHTGAESVVYVQSTAVQRHDVLRSTQ